MRFLWRGCAVLLCLLSAGLAPAQQNGQNLSRPVAFASASSVTLAPKGNTPRWTRYCFENGGFCFDHPAEWTNLGAVYDDAGVVFAEPNKQRTQADWNQITAAAIDLPEPTEDSQRPSMNDLINQVMTPSQGASIHTVERMETVVGGYPAQVITAEVQEQNKPLATERVAFIDADDVLYTVALRCAPTDFHRLQPVFLKVLRSWRELPAASQPETGVAPNEQPKK